MTKDVRASCVHGFGFLPGMCKVLHGPRACVRFYTLIFDQFSLRFSHIGMTFPYGTYRYRSMSIPIPIPIISVSAIYSQGQYLYRYRPILCYYQCGADAKAAFFLITIAVTGISMTERTHHAIFL